MKDTSISQDTFTTFGDLLKYLRKRAQLTQQELAIAVGYSEAQISRLENNRYPPERSRLSALFIPALHLEEEPEVVRRLIDLAEAAHTETPTLAPRTWTDRVILPKSNLPSQLTSFVGRRKELSAVCELLNEPNTRLLTLTGAGGCGKTRLALRAGEAIFQAYVDGVWLVELASLSDPTLVTPAVIQSLGLLLGKGEEPETALLGFLRTRRLLLILDNCEHLIEKCAWLVENLLRACPDLQILATSREALHSPGEVIYRVPSLSLPPELVQTNESCQEISYSDAVQLFAERARLVGSGFCLSEVNAVPVAQICRRLDGIPLAIELVAARIRMITPEQIAARLDDAFRLLTSDSRTALPRHRTLKATLDWSYYLLSEKERILFRRLSVFADGWDLADAEAVCCDPEGSLPSTGFLQSTDILDILSGLTSKSMVIVDQERKVEARYRLLETIRQYAREKLNASGEIADLRRHHLAYFLKLAEEAEEKLHGAEQAAWYERLERNLANIRLALEWGLETDPLTALRLASGMHFFWVDISPQEGFRWLEACLQKPENAPRSVFRGRALGILADIAISLDIKYQERQKWAEEALDICQELGDEAGQASAHHILGYIAYEQFNNYPAAKAHHEASLELFRAAGNRWGEARCLMIYADVSLSSGIYVTARMYVEQSLKIFQDLQDERGIALTLVRRADILGEFAGNLQIWREGYEQALAIVQKLKLNNVLVYLLDWLDWIAIWQGDMGLASEMEEKIAEYCSQTGGASLVFENQFNKCRSMVLQGRFAQAVDLLEQTFHQFAALLPQEVEPFRMITNSLYAEALTFLGQIERAKACLSQHDMSKFTLYSQHFFLLRTRGLVAFMEDNGPEAARNYHESLEYAWKTHHKLNQILGLEGCAGALFLLGLPREAVHCLASAAAFRKACGTPVWRGDQPFYARVREGLLAQLGEAAFMQTWEEGEAIPFDQAVETAVNAPQLLLTTDNYPGKR